MSALSDYIASIAAPVAHYSMSEATGALLSAGGGDDATVSGTVTRGVASLVAGAADGALTWGGVAARASTASGAKWILGSAGFTVATVIRYTSSSFGAFLAIKNGTTVMLVMTVSRFTAGDIAAECWGWETVTTRARSAASFNDGKAHVVVVRYRATEQMLDLFVDGVLVDSRYQGDGRPTSSSLYALTIGNNSSGSDQGVVGLTQDETVLWSSALTDTQIAQVGRAMTDGVPVSVSGNCTTTAGVEADAVMVWKWSTGALYARSEPGSDGAWTAAVPPGQYGITYVADGCQPITHGPYTVAAS